jgi:tetratricopeptide (TPR) repeat protein
MTQSSSLRQGVRFLLVSALLFLLLLTLHGRLAADPADWISQAQERLRLGDREGALKAFQQAAWQSPQDPAIHYNLGVLAQSLGRLGESVGYYMAYLRWAPEAPDRETVKRRVFQLCGELAAQAYQNRQYLRALDWYGQARELYPYSKTIHFNLSRVYEARGEWERAAASLKEYHTLCGPTEKGPNKKRIADCLRKAAETMFSAGDYDGSLARYQEAARWDTEDSGLLLHQASCEEKLGLLEDAKNHYLAYLQVNPMTEQREAILERVIRLHVLLAEEYLRQGYLARAEDILGKGIEVDPENPDLYSLLAKTCIGLGRPEQAVAYLERILELSPEQATNRPYVEELVGLCTSLADEAYQEREYADALRFLQKALYWAPENPLVAYNLARVYEREAQWEQAILAYRRYLYLDPDARERKEVKAKLAYYYSFLGTERFVRGEYPQAQEAFEQALLVSPEDEALLYNLATVLLKRGKTTEALHFLERYLKYERDPEEIERVQRQVNLLVSRIEQKNRRKIGKSVASGLASLEDHKGGREDRALDDRRTGYLLLQAGRWQEALDKYEKCLRRVPSVGTEEAFQNELASAYREVSREALVRGDMAEALEALERAREWAPTQAFPYLWQGKVYEHRGDDGAALEVYQESLRNVRGENGRQAIRNRIVAILTERLQAALRQEDLSDALGAMNDLEPYLGESQARDVHYQKARIEEALGRKEEALVDYGLHLFEASQVLQDPRIRGEILTLIRDDPDLLASIDDPSDAYSRGRESANRGEHAKALFCFLVARSDERAPADLDSEIFRSLEALRMGGEALTILSRPSEGGKPFILPKTQAAQLARKAESVLLDDYRTGHYERGLERIRSIQVQLSEPDGRLSLLQGVFEEMMGSYEKAIHRYERALHSEMTLSPERISPVRQRLCALLIRQALSEYEEGDYEACLESLRRAERVVPGRADVAFDLGCAYLRLKNPEGALPAFSRYLEIAREESPRKQLTGSAILLLQRQLARSPVVRYDGEGIAVDLIFERPVSLGHLLSGEEYGEGDEKLMDSVVLAPYLDVRLGEEGLEDALPF